MLALQALGECLLEPLAIKAMIISKQLFPGIL